MLSAEANLRCAVRGVVVINTPRALMIIRTTRSLFPAIECNRDGVHKLLVICKVFVDGQLYVANQHSTAKQRRTAAVPV